MDFQILGFFILLGIGAVFVYMLAMGPGNPFSQAMIDGLETLDVDELSPASLNWGGRF